MSSGFGIYFGRILVFLKSRPTMDVPLGMITPPLILLNFTRSFVSCVKSKLEFNVSGIGLTDCPPWGVTVGPEPLII